MPILQIVVAATGAYVFALYVLGHPAPLLAATVTVSSLGLVRDARPRRVLETVLGRSGLHVDDIAAWILHAGGRDVLLALERRFEVDADAFRYSAAMLREYGNLSSAFVYFVLEAALADRAPAGWWWLSAFGAGFSCHGALLEVGDA